MKRLFAWIILIIGAWLVISPWVLGYQPVAARWNACAIGLAIAVLSLLVLLCKTERVPSWPQLITCLFGLWSVGTGAFAFGQAHWSELVCGILVAVFSLVASQLTEGRKIAIYTKDSNVLLEMNGVTYKDGQIVLRGKTFGTMPSTMYVRPVDMWNLVGMVPFIVIRMLPWMLIMGWKTGKASGDVPRRVRGS
jgi:hypothetical protein